ncbi:exodeoxyribonuclease VII large subunit [Paracoccus sp. S-4012]|uniref:exodeoxyribonuclease VII large subunit n=1 Tax=Paracoccus sp. S-4012 TaxID=2665648 RepID=UPI0012B04DD8|nr:exodeoxyribonuclease VII large subunit [Paracoccus sp. S-4012]MRX51718.1 exodeoxyribonuclease VII large subunit [Paracoccus sp. S-4012]
MDLFEDAAPSNAPALSVSEISGAVKRVIEGEFGRVRVRGEVGRVSRPSSGHLYFDLKDDNACIAAVCWRTQAARLAHRPEEGMEIIVSGRLTTFPGASKYQLLVESVEPAGLGALMAMLEQRRKALAAEGLFDAARKRALPSLPRVIGVVTSPSGAVIRDILHRLRDRFPVHVVIWPVAVQGAACAPEVAAAIAGFNALGPGGPVPRPDLIIVARGGGSVEDLWGFNDEAVVRAVAAGTIPLISAVGHETDTTLIDHAADLRAPTPTAAAELAVPVRSELVARLAEIRARQVRAMQTRVALPGQRLRDLARAMGRPQALTEGARQRFDLTAARLEPALRGFTRSRRDRLNALPLPPALLRQGATAARRRLEEGARLEPALRRRAQIARSERDSAAAKLRPAIARRLREMARDLDAGRRRLDAGLSRARMAGLRRNAECRAQLDGLGKRLAAAEARQTRLRRERLDRLDRLRQTLGYRETLKRGFAVVHGPEGLVASAVAGAALARLEIEFHDGRLGARPEGARAKPAARPPGGQGTLF